MKTKPKGPAVLSKSKVRSRVRSPRVTYRILAGQSAVAFDLKVAEHGLESIMGAAYLLMDRAFVALRGDRARRMTVILRAKEKSAARALRGLAATFVNELKTQKVRWAIAKNNLPVREHITELAVLLANGGALEAPPPPGPSVDVDDALTEEQRKEIETLISEVEEEIRVLNEKKTVSDPRNIKASWEEKQQSKTTVSGAAVPGTP